jgi:uncharacterized small protein (DUF1192 family)
LPAASDAEEDTMDEELGALNAVADVDDAEAVDDAEGADLSVYKDPNVQASVTRRNKLAADYKKYYDDLTAKIMAQRTGPSFSERMYQLSAAFASPTSTRGFGGVMGNIMPVLQEQAKARREGVNKRQDALSALQAAQLAQRVGLANQDVTTATAMAKINAAEKKSQEPKLVFADGAWRLQPGTGGYPAMPTMDQFGNYIITDRRQIEYLPPNTPVVEVGQDPMKPKYVPDRSNPDR